MWVVGRCVLQPELLSMNKIFKNYVTRGVISVNKARAVYWLQRHVRLCAVTLLSGDAPFLARALMEWRGGLFTGQREASLAWGGRGSPQRAVHSARSCPRPPPRQFCLQMTWACWLALPIPSAPSHCPPSCLSSIRAEPAVGPGLGHCPPPPGNTV